MKIAFGHEPRNIKKSSSGFAWHRALNKRDLMSVVRNCETDPENSIAAGRDAALLLEAQLGSNSSLGQLLQGYRDYLNLLADEELGSAIKVKASASDVVQDSFLEAKRDFGQFSGQSPEEFQAWLRRLLLNNVANVIRSYQGTEKRDISKETSTSHCDVSAIRPIAVESRTASSIVMKNELLDALQLAIKRLPGHYQDVIQWRNYDRASFEEIGKRMERSAEAARKLWVRAVELLQQELDATHEAGTPGSRIAVH